MKNNLSSTIRNLVNLFLPKKHISFLLIAKPNLFSIRYKVTKEYVILSKRMNFF